jgi:hypothetical protein
MTVSALVHASVNIALAPSPTPWSYALCDDGYASNTIRSIGKCIAFEEGKWNGNYSPCTDTSPISEGNAVDHAKNFTRYVHQACDDLNAQRPTTIDRTFPRYSRESVKFAAGGKFSPPGCV